MMGFRYKVGDEVEYMGYYSHEPPQLNCVITGTSEGDNAFSGPCYKLDKVSCWVSQGEIRRYENE